VKKLLRVEGGSSVLTVVVHPSGTIDIDLAVNKGALPPLVSVEEVHGATLVRVSWEDDVATVKDALDSSPPPLDA